MTGGEENHIVMNERVQALAGSIYEVIKYSCKHSSFSTKSTKIQYNYFSHPFKPFYSFNVIMK